MINRRISMTQEKCKSIVKVCVVMVLLVTASTKLMAQKDTLYYDAKWKTTVKDSAAFFRPPAKKQGEFYKTEDFYVSGALQMSGLSSSLDNDIWEGEVTWYNEDGSMLQQGTYKNNRLDGEYISTLAGKKLKAKFENGRMVSGKTNGKFNNGRQYYTEIKGDTTVNIIHDKDINGVRYERYSVGKQYDVLIKYFDVDGEFIGQRESLPNGEIQGLVVSYYKTPMRPMEIQYYPNGKRMGTTFFYCKDQVREEFSSENELSKTFYSPEGAIIGKINYTYDNNYLIPLDGKEYVFYSSHKEYKGELIKSIREYSGGKLVKDEQFYENQNLMSSTSYSAGAKELQISYNEKGEEIARMVYENWMPMNGTEIIGDRKTTYKDGKLIVEINDYYNTQVMFSKKTLTTETYYAKDGSVLGSLTMIDDRGYPKPMNGDRYTIDYEGDINAIERYENGFITQRTSYRKRQVGQNETVTFKKVALFEPDGYKRTKEIRFYSNGNKQSEIEFKDFKETAGIFYDDRENVIGEYNYETKEGTVYEFFGDSDKVKQMETRKNGKQLRLKRYDYGPDTSFGQINPVLVEDVDTSCCASFYSREGELLGKVIFKDGQAWEGSFYDVKQSTSYTIKEGKRNGSYKKYDYDRSIMEEGNFISDKEEGLFTYYSYNGELVKTENYTNGKLNGMARYYDKNEAILGEMMYADGAPISGTRITTTYSSKEPITETYAAGMLVKRISYDDNGKRISNYVDGMETETTAYYGDTDKKRLTYSVKGSNLDGTVIRYDLDGKQQYKALFESGKLKEGAVMLTRGNVRGNPEYIILTRKPDTLNVKLMGQNDKVLFTAEEDLAFGTATVFMQSLDIYMDYLGPNRLY
ncbi:toxin-antitoxin system YwqK family antitoxin [Maribacter chungangensis]|uniref:Toxin-antitoxin system YwqK family antitoxin n=1 Tax=Maribacter chungangensis TaxID=1069117 RepID=A0ABW3B190_9FLAO